MLSHPSQKYALCAMRHSNWINWIISPYFPTKIMVKMKKLKPPPRGYFSGLKWWKRFGETCRKLSSSLGSVHQYVPVPEMDVLMHLSNTDSKNPWWNSLLEKSTLQIRYHQILWSCFWCPGNFRVEIQLDVAQHHALWEEKPPPQLHQLRSSQMWLENHSNKILDAAASPPWNDNFPR